MALEEGGKYNVLHKCRYQCVDREGGKYGHTM